MDIPTWIQTGLIAITVAVLSLSLSYIQAKRLQRNQWERNQLDLRRDVLRRLVGYRYRLTTDYVGTEGEPFIALNEIGIVFAESPKVIEAFDSFRSDREQGKPLAHSLTALIRALCEDVGLPMNHLTKDFIDYPLAPPNQESHTPDSPSHPSVGVPRMSKFG